jgi:GT2 family glycosyltransferase/glycosyltransferase involved in cell wall biosynthesis
MKTKPSAASRPSRKVPAKPSLRQVSPTLSEVDLADPADEPGAAHHVAALAPPTKPEHAFQGNLDSCGPDFISGWLHDTRQPGAAFEVEIRVNGKPVARARADLFRKDLLESKIGDGRCAFQLPLPEIVYDGLEHLVEVREASSGFLLPGSPRTIVAKAAVRGEIRLENGALTGTARVNGIDSSKELEVLDLQSSKVVASGQSELDDANTGTLRFSVPLPAELFDGRPHAFSLRVKGEATLLHDIAVVMPYASTPESALLQYARNAMTPALATAAGFRYESLTASLSLLAEGQTQKNEGAQQLPLAAQMSQLVRVHAKLVRGFDARDQDFDPLVFPEVAQPDVSIVIPVHNKFHVTYHCLASLLLAPTRATFEVILVDDGSEDLSTDAPRLIKGIKYVRNEKAQGFIRSCNKGGSVAKGRYIVMLNNDTEVTAGWLDELLWPFEHFEGVGMTGAKLLYADGSLQEAGGIVWSSGNPWNYGRNANAHDPRYNYARQVDYLSGACLMLPTELWNQIGGFSEEYLPAYFEDTDLGFQVRDRGFKTVYTPTAQVFHFEGMSNGTSVASGTKRFQEVNRPKFKARWSAACRGNGKEGVDVELAKDRNVELRALVIDAQMPMPDKDAGSYAAIQEMRMLQALGFKCTFVPQNMAWLGHYTQNLQRMGIETLFAPFCTSISQILEQRGEEFDLVYITRYYVAREYIDLIRQHAPRAKIVLMNADLHFLRELRHAIQTKNPADMSKSLQTRDDELTVMRKVDLVLSYTDVEKAVILSHNLDSTKVEKCPWVTEVASQVPPFSARKDIAFLGGFNHYPNTQAVEWFLAHVMPLLRKQLPGVKLRVYGSYMPDSLADKLKEHDDVVAEGWVESVQDVYDHCRVFVAPLQSGAGIKGKVIGALAHGVPTVMSPVAAEGIAVSDGSDAFVAATPQEWVTAIANLYGSEEAWSKMSKNGLDSARKQFGFAAGVTQMRQALQTAELFTSAATAALSART